MDTDVKIAVKALTAKQEPYNQLWAYFDGNQPLVYSTKRLREVFKDINTRFTQNWCEVVVASVLERLTFDQYVVLRNAQATDALKRWWELSEMDVEADDVHLCALVTGEAFVIVEQDDDGRLQAYYNDSRLVHVEYDAANPRQMRFAAKWWMQNDSRARLTLYYPGRIEYYVTDKKVDRDKLTEQTSFSPYVEPGGALESAVVENPWGVIPVWHFRRERRAIKGELGPSVLDLQDAVNKLFADMMIAAEFSAFKQRYIISNADIGNLKNAPNEIWDIPAGDGLGQDTEVGEFAETSLGNFMSAIQDLAVSIAKITRTPQSYFFLGARSDPSGEALIAMEGPLLAKVDKIARRFAITWAQLGRFVAGRLDIGAEPAALRALFASPRTVQPLTQGQAREVNVRAGIPLRTLLRTEGWTEQEIQQLEDDKAAEAAAGQAQLARALLDAERARSQEMTADA